jgi:hypothetical protein
MQNERKSRWGTVSANADLLFQWKAICLIKIRKLCQNVGSFWCGLQGFWEKHFFF